MFESLFNSMKKQPAVKSAGRFFSWWKTELLSGLPEGVREFLSPRKPHLYVWVEDAELVFSEQIRGEALKRIELEDDPAIANQQIVQLLNRYKDNQVRVVLLLDAETVLAVERKVPSAVVDNLRQVIGFEMDRYTPFTRDQVRYDVRVLDDANSSGQLPVELVYAPAANVDRLIRLARERGLPLDAVDVVEEPAVEGDQDAALQTHGINLLEPDERARHNQRQFWINMMLGGLFIILLYSLMWLSIGSREQQIQAFQAQVDQARRDSAQVRQLQQQLDDTRQASQFLGKTRSQSARTVELLREITARLPDEVWLSRFQLTQNVLRLNGEAPKAETLIAILADSPLLTNVTVDGAITAGTDGKERFRLKMDIVVPQIEEASDGTVAAR